MIHARALLICTLMTLFSACSKPVAQGPVELVRVAPVQLAVEADGELKSTKATSLQVPGPLWSQRQLSWLITDGSAVKRGDVVARFSANQGQLDLKQAMLDLQRTALARAEKQDGLASQQGRVDVDLAKVSTDLAIAHRYSDMPLQMFAHDKVLDAVQDQHFLGDKQNMLRWQRGQSGKVAATQLAVLDAQHATFDLSAKTMKDNLDALVLTAPHDGIVMLQENWSGDKPQLGGTMWAGQELASLPDPHALQVEMALPQLDAQGLQVGDAVSLYPVGRPQQAIETKLSWVASSAQVRSQQSSVKYIVIKADVLEADALRNGWVPGQSFHARVFIKRAKQGITVPNVALITDAGRTFVAIADGSHVSRHAVEIGARGTARSEVVKGLSGGERILLLPPHAKDDGS